MRLDAASCGRRCVSKPSRTELILEGTTYPQEGPMDYDAFFAYFFATASTTVIGVLHSDTLSNPPSSLEEARAGRDWEECVGGCFYM